MTVTKGSMPKCNLVEKIRMSQRTNSYCRKTRIQKLKYIVLKIPGFLSELTNRIVVRLLYLSP